MPAYRALYRDWLPDSGFLMTDLPPYEIYHNAPDVDPASKYVFDLCVPVEAL
jgi:DNA gyrase inhibitor GyrI